MPQAIPKDTTGNLYNVVFSDMYHLSIPAPIKLLRQVCLASPDLLHMHLALAAMRFNHYYKY